MQKTKRICAANNRFTVTIPTECVQKMQKLQQERFFDESRATMIRYVIKLGLEAAARENERFAQH